MSNHLPDVYRRDLIKSVGAGVSTAGLGAGAVAAGSGTAAAAMEGTVPEDGWVEPVWDYHQEVYEQERIGGTIKSVHKLAYLDASWEAFGDPSDGSGGCWRHTFSLSSIGTHQTISEAGDWTMWDAPLSPSDVSVHVPGEQPDDDHESVAVAPRRDSNLFGFYDRETLFKDVLLDDGDEYVDDAVLESLRAPPSEHQSLENEHLGDVQARIEEEENQRLLEEYGPTAVSINLALLQLSDIESVSNTASRLGTILGLADIGYDAIRLLTGIDAPPRFDRGFSQRAPDSVTGNDWGIGGHFLVFDVYTSPGDGPTVEVASTYPHDDEDYSMKGSWTVEFDGGPDGPDAADPGDEFFATAESDEDVEPRSASLDAAAGDAEGLR